MLKTKRGLKQYLLIPAVTLAILPLATTAHADSAKPAKSHQNVKQALGLKVAVVGAADTAGNKDVALRALQAANIGLERQSDYKVEDPETVASALNSANLHWPFAPSQYPDVRKKLDKADRVLSVTVSPKPGTNNTYHAVAEMYDTTTGGLVGRGESTYTVSSPVPDSKNSTPQMRAVDGAVLGAIYDMNRPAVLNGVVVSRPQGYRVRISLGTAQGLRNGSRIEYMADGQPIAYGTAIDVGIADAVATVAPESAFNEVQVNTIVRTANIPPQGLEGLSRQQISQKEYDKFSKTFVVGAVLAGIASLIFY